jgi:hypothetical protein
MKVSLDYNPLTGESCYMHFSGDSFRIINEQNVTPIIDANKRLANNESLTRKGIKKDLLHYACVPNIVILKWKQELGVDLFNRAHRKKVFSLLNSPEYKYLKTTTITHDGK